MNMKNETLFTLKKVIEQVKEKGTNKFKLPLILNEMKIDEHIKALEELRKPSKKYEEFLEKRKAIVSEHAAIDEKGQIILYSLEGGQGERKYDFGYPNIVKDVPEFKTKSEALETQYKTTLDAEKKKQDAFLKTLEEDADIELKKIAFEDVPELDYDHLKVLMQIIEP